jgi:hypothetical protein
MTDHLRFAEGDHVVWRFSSGVCTGVIRDPKAHTGTLSWRVEVITSHDGAEVPESRRYITLVSDELLMPFLDVDALAD